MIVRKGFITNSSSTSFIFYGVDIDSEDLDRFAEKLMGEHKKEEWRSGAAIRTFAENTVYTRQKPPVGMHYDYESGIQLFANASYIEMDECGVEDLPMKELRSFTPEQEMEWTELIKEFCTEWNLPFPRPSWQIAIYINR
jgi:hypothetical protein